MLILPVLSFFALLPALVASSPTSIPGEEKRQAVTQLQDYDYIVVGSGAGGGPLAARLAIYGQKVLLLEAGDDQGTALQQSIPAFFAASSEYIPMSWDFFVRHYPDDKREARNDKATYTTPTGETYIGLNPPAGSTLKGIWYPRAGTLGGCAAHNAMVTVYPHEEDWNYMALLTGDSSWNAGNMRKYFKRLERNQYINDPNSKIASGHGFDGWLGTEQFDLDLMAEDSQVVEMVSAANTVMKGSPQPPITNAAGLAAAFPIDMNTDYSNRDRTESLYQIPMATLNGARSSPRDFILATAGATYANGTKKYQLDIRTHAFVTKVRFSKPTDGSAPVALGVDFLDGESLYKADPRAGSNTGTPGRVNAKKEVILAAGAFNTPQILMLSGVGPKDELKRFNIPVVANLQGVGANLADHYEISSTFVFDDNFSFLSKCTFLTTPDDPCFLQYLGNATDKGPYATTLLPVSALLKSGVADFLGGSRDMFMFGGPINFHGYFQGYTNAALADLKHWSWVALKAHELNSAGRITLKSANPLDTPNINFNFFDAGTTVLGADQLDIKPMVEGLKWSRNVVSKLPADTKFTEERPGAAVKTDEELKTYIRDQAWGHHAACTAKMGPSWDSNSVVDSKFRVRGVKGLRIVDASIFPVMPGFFPVMSVYMIGEKAADVIVADNA